MLVASTVYAEVPFSIKNEIEGKALVKYLSILEDTNASFVPAEVLAGKYDSNFKKLEKENLGFSSSQFWFRLPVENLENQNVSWLLEFDFPLLDEVQIFSKSLPQGYLETSGDRISFANRKLHYRNVIFPLTEKAQSGNVYYFRIKSESTIPVSVKAWSTEELLNKMTKEQIIFGLFYGIMLVMILYNTSIYVFTRELSYLLYVLFITSISLFHLSNNGLAFQYLWPDATWWANACLPFFMVTSSSLGQLFAIYFLSLRSLAPRFAKYMQYWYQALAITSILILFFPYRMATLVGIALAIISAFIMIASGVIAFIRRGRTAKFYLVAWSFFLLGVLLYSLKSLGVLPDNQITRWTIQIGTAIEVVLLSLGLADRINSLSKSLRDNLRELSSVKAKIEESEKRFKEIFQGSEEVMLLLDENTRVINANRALTKQLGFRVSDLMGKPLEEFLYPVKGKKAGFNSLYLNEKFQELKITGNVGRFVLDFSQKYVKEPKDMYVRMQYIEFGDLREIFVTMASQLEDSIINYIDEERIEFTISNYLRNAELVSQKVTSNLGKHLSSIAQTEIRTSVREIIINAIEHGNLNIGFDEKSQALVEGNYLEFLQKRQEDPRYSRKVIKIEYVLTEEYVAYRITDEGKGFDHKQILSRSLESLNEAHEQHGRGIHMTKSVFDRVEYNDSGNQVRLIKYFRH